QFRVRQPAHLLRRRFRVWPGGRDRHFDQPPARPRAGGPRRPDDPEMGPHRRRAVAGIGVLWVKAFHILFVIAWFAGLFYLPRIYVNLAQTDEPGARRVLL